MGGLGIPGLSPSGGFGVGNIVAGLIFSTIGFFIFKRGRSEGSFQSMLLGGALMTYCYFTPTTLWTVGVGVAILVGARFLDD